MTRHFWLTLATFSDKLNANPDGINESSRNLHLNDSLKKLTQTVFFACLLNAKIHKLFITSPLFKKKKGLPLSHITLPHIALH